MHKRQRSSDLSQEKSRMTHLFTQAYQQAPWRLQLQRIGGFLAVLVAVVLVAGVYLFISAQSATAGLEIQSLERQREALDRTIADHRAVLAEISSASAMNKRATEMGFVNADMSTAIYMEIPGYEGRQSAMIAPPPSSITLSSPIIKQSYRQSLWEWFFEGVLGNSSYGGY
jgi:cell division protein FtsL